MKSKTVPFDRLSDKMRMALRRKIEETGAQVEGYSNGQIQVALPSPRNRKVTETIFQIESLGFVSQGGAYFPLGSDSPPDILRHFGPGTHGAPRGEQPAYWLYWNFAFNWYPDLEIDVPIKEMEFK